MRSGIRVVTLLGVLAANCLAGILVAGPASADKPASVPLARVDSTVDFGQRTLLETAARGADDGQVQPFTTTLTKKASNRDVSAQEIITCGGFVSTPAVEGSAIVVDVEASCDGTVDTIRIAAGLARGSILVDYNEPPIVGPANFHNARAQTPCPGYIGAYEGYGAATFTKAGYQNSPLTLSGRTGYVNITC